MQTIEIHGDLHASGDVGLDTNRLPIRIIIRGENLRPFCQERPERGMFIEGSLLVHPLGTSEANCGEVLDLRKVAELRIRIWSGNFILVRPAMSSQRSQPDTP